MIFSNIWPKGILNITCNIKPNITDIISRIDNHSCNIEGWHFNLNYWIANCNFSSQDFKLILNNIYQHLVVKCRDTIVAWAKFKPFCAYLDFSNEAQKVAPEQIKDAAKFLCNVMSNFSDTGGKLLSVIINLSDNATYTHEAIELLKDSPAIIIHEGYEDFHGLYTNNALVRNHSCMIQEGENRLPYHEPSNLPLQMLVAIAGVASCLTMAGLLGKIVARMFASKPKTTPAAFDHNISLTELTDINELEPENCAAVAVIGGDNASLISSSL